MNPIAHQLKRNLLCGLFLLSLLGLSPFAARAQVESTVVDSLKYELRTSELSDEDQLITYQELAVAYLQVNLDSVFFYGQFVLAAEQELPLPEVRIQVLNTLGLYHDTKRQFDSAFYYYDRSLALAQSKPSPVMEVVILNNIGLSHYKLKATGKAKAHYERGYTLAKDLLERGVEDRFQVILQRGQAGNRYNFGMCYFIEGDYALSLDYLQESLAIYKETQDAQGQTLVYKQIGLVLSRSGNYEQAKIMYEAGLPLAEAQSDHRMQILMHLSLASVKRNLGEYEQGAQNIDQAEALLEEFPNVSLSITLQTQRAQLLLAGEDYEEAIAALDSAKAIALANNAASRINKLHLHYAKGFLALGRFTLAREHLRGATTANQAGGTVDKMATTLKLWKNFYELTGHPDSALRYANQYMALQDSLVPQATRDQISVMYARFWSEEQEHALALAQKNEEIKEKEAAAEKLKAEQLTVQRNFTIIGALLLLILAYVGYRGYNARRKAATLQRLTELELKALRSQMNPHFLFNALNGVQGMINKNEMRSANLFLSRCAKLTRAYLEQSEVATVRLEVELNTIKLYLELEALRFDFEYHIDIADEVDADALEVPSMLIQPYVENAILHGISKKKAGGRLTIEMKLEGDRLHCVIEDNGIGRKQAASSKKTHTSMGMNITESRFKKLQDGHQQVVPEVIDLTDAEGNATGTRVELQIPVLNLAD